MSEAALGVFLGSLHGAPSFLNPQACWHISSISFHWLGLQPSLTEGPLSAGGYHPASPFPGQKP